MKWTVTRWFTGGYRAYRAGGSRAYIYRALSLPEISRGRSDYEVKYGGTPVGMLRFEGKGALVKVLPGAGRFPELTSLDLAELALWIGKLRGRGGPDREGN